MKVHASIGLGVPEILVPGADVAPETWAVIACDQYTSQPEYWARVAEHVGEAPSTLHIIFPEVFLEEDGADARIARISDTMRRYVDEGVLVPHEGMVYVEREAAGRRRRGLMVCLDLEAYDYNRGSGSLIRATEGTIVSRLPPRMKVREGALLETPHIMVLLDDPEDTVLGPLEAAKARLPKLYDFELMLGAGHLAGYSAAEPDHEAAIVAALEALADPEGFADRYELERDAPVLLYAMGDGNHSLATAKAIWEKVKAADPSALESDPRRYALVELVNLHDTSMEFEPIHRVLFGVKDGAALVDRMMAHFGDGARVAPAADLSEMTRAVEASTPEVQRFGVVSEHGYQVMSIEGAQSNLPVGTLQGFLDPAVETDEVEDIDYVHGTAAVDELGKKAGNLGFFLPPMDKYDLFKTVILDGALPRKTFSMGEADEKRFYMECRRIG